MAAKQRIPTQQQVADSLGISRGTVDRALHDRKGVNEETKKLVVEKVKSLGYRPNRLASFLSTGKTLNIAMITPAEPLSFWKSVKEGARAFSAVAGDHVVNVTWHETGVHDIARETEILGEVLENGVDGIGIAPADPEKLANLIDRAVRRHIAVATLNTDAPNSRRICFVGQDHLRAGRVAGELMGKFLMGSGNVLAITAFHNVLAHRQRLDAFVELMRQRYQGISIVGVFENHDNEEEAYEHVRSYLSTRKLNGIYLTSGVGVSGVSKALIEAELACETRVVCFDFFPDTVRLVKQGLVHATIGQDPFTQGYEAAKVLYDYIVERRQPVGGTVHTRIDIGLRENIDLLARDQRLGDRQESEKTYCP